MDEENDKAKKRSVIAIVVLSILVLLFLTSSIVLGVILVNKKDNSKNNDSDNEVVENEKSNISDKENNLEDNKEFEFDGNDNGEDISIIDSEVVRLHNLVSASTNDYDVYSSDSFLVKDMTPYDRAILARNLYKDKIVFIGENPYYYNGKQYFHTSKYEIDEQIVIDSYNSLFGEGYYSSENNEYCNILCCVMKYDATSKKYAGEQDGCGVVANDVDYYEFENIIRAVKYSDRLEITVSVMFVSDYNFENDYTYYYSDSKRTNKLPLDNVLIDEAKEYQRNNSLVFDRYTYIFKLNNGQYNYYGVYKNK